MNTEQTSKNIFMYRFEKFTTIYKGLEKEKRANEQAEKD